MEHLQLCAQGPIPIATLQIGCFGITGQFKIEPPAAENTGGKLTAFGT